MAILITSCEEVDACVQEVLDACCQTVDGLGRLLSSGNPLQVFHTLRFQEVGFDGLFKRRQNVVEQLNQTFTYLVTLQAVKELLLLHPKGGPYIVNAGARGGPDIKSNDGTIVAEAFAAVRPSNNKKLTEDLRRCSNYDAKHKYVFFYSPAGKVNLNRYKREYPDIGIQAIALTEP